MKKIYVVTHGEYEEKPNPSLTTEGKKQMKRIKKFLASEKFDLIISGVGERHKEACRIILDQESDIKKEPIGVPEIISLDWKVMIFPDATRVPVEEYTKTRYQELLVRLKPILDDLFERDGKNALVIGGRIVAISLGIEDAASGFLYVFDENRNLVSIFPSSPVLQSHNY